MIPEVLTCYLLHLKYQLDRGPTNDQAIIDTDHDIPKVQELKLLTNSKSHVIVPVGIEINPPSNSNKQTFPRDVVKTQIQPKLN